MKRVAQSLGLFLVVLASCSFSCSGQNGPTPTPVPSVVLTWVQSTGPGTITTNNVYRCTQTSTTACVPAPPAIATVTPAATTYTDKAVAISTTYVYAVTASSTVGEGAYSNTVTAVVPAAPVTPAAPDLNSPSETGKNLKAKVQWR
jgi:hypothetical protein